MKLLNEYVSAFKWAFAIGLGLAASGATVYGVAKTAKTGITGFVMSKLGGGSNKGDQPLDVTVDDTQDDE